MEDLNLRPPRCERGALTTELTALVPFDFNYMQTPFRAQPRHLRLNSGCFDKPVLILPQKDEGLTMSGLPGPLTRSPSKGHPELGAGPSVHFCTSDSGGQADHIPNQVRIRQK